MVVAIYHENVPRTAFSDLTTRFDSSFPPPQDSSARSRKRDRLFAQNLPWMSIDLPHRQFHLVFSATIDVAPTEFPPLPFLLVLYVPICTEIGQIPFETRKPIGRYHARIVSQERLIFRFNFLLLSFINRVLEILSVYEIFDISLVLLMVKSSFLPFFDRCFIVETV